jgi:hypothetical protein
MGECVIAQVELLKLQKKGPFPDERIVIIIVNTIFSNFVIINLN